MEELLLPGYCKDREAFEQAVSAGATPPPLMQSLCGRDIWRTISGCPQERKLRLPLWIRSANGAGKFEFS